MINLDAANPLSKGNRLDKGKAFLEFVLKCSQDSVFATEKKKLTWNLLAYGLECAKQPTDQSDRELTTTTGLLLFEPVGEESLQECMKSGKLKQFVEEQFSEKQLQNRFLLNLCDKIAEGVSRLHSANIVHGNLHPANIVVKLNH